MLRFFEHAHSEAPAHVDTLVRLGVARQREGDVAGAREVLVAAHEVEPASAPPQPLVPAPALCCCGGRDSDGRLTPTEWGADPYLALALGACEHEAGNREEALRLYRHAERLQRKLPTLAAHLGRLHLDMGAPRRALPALQRAVAEDPGDAGAQVHFGVALLAAGEAGAAAEAAERAFSQALSADPRFPQAHLGLATVAHRAGRLGEAAEHYEATLAEQPRNPRALFGVGCGGWHPQRDARRRWSLSPSPSPVAGRCCTRADASRRRSPATRRLWGRTRACSKPGTTWVWSWSPWIAWRIRCGRSSGRTNCARRAATPSAAWTASRQRAAAGARQRRRTHRALPRTPAARWRRPSPGCATPTPWLRRTRS